MQLSSAENSLVSADMFSQLFTMHALTMIFLAIMPLSVRFLQHRYPIADRGEDVAFPRLNAIELLDISSLAEYCLMPAGS